MEALKKDQRKGTQGIRSSGLKAPFKKIWTAIF
jgi:hypothetical protein